MKAAAKISLDKNQAWLKRTMDVLIEGEKDGRIVGRSHRDAPEIDGLVYVEGQTNPGDIVKVEIQQVGPYDLFGRVISS